LWIGVLVVWSVTAVLGGAFGYSYWLYLNRAPLKQVGELNEGITIETEF